MEDFSSFLHVITWELTKACHLHCRHCRARAIPNRNEGELDIDEIQSVLLDISNRLPRKPIMVFTGGDPTERPDLDEILKSSIEMGFITSISPSVTNRVTPELVYHWAELGVRAISLSIDGPSPEIHDRFRGVKGTFERSIEIARTVVDAKMSLQINTSIGRFTLDGLAEMADLAKDLKVSSWEVFFVIPMGRAKLSSALDSSEMEEVLRYLATFSRSVDFRVTAVGAPQFQRVLHEMNYLETSGLRPSVREGRGFAFIDHLGEVYPSGYLPLSGGNVRSQSLVDIYSSSPLFTSMRDPSNYSGACGSCDYSGFCGGSRARAFAVTKDVLASDPGCPRTDSYGSFLDLEPVELVIE
ncbi:MULTISPECIES: radical SAM protein [Acidithrix]|uniref:Antilisterial bacteriocin subtilosin biosynthesis protein AlbA n=1 Tax=Acidithrix ferrooxidans TaxID=1280514 RepID=A0A0D8HL27_9ACTN|nr:MULTISPECIES: radical SAM protein [Acidithrix]KJF18554.1 antilisterial bacteriocin subtilosin biosynthesis protein AlbA [Acidithrix ferrooxidans]